MSKKIEPNNIVGDWLYDDIYDVRGESIRNKIQYNAYGIQTVFEAIALTDPFPLDASQASLFFESKTLKAQGGLFERLAQLWEDQDIAPTAPQTMSKFIIKARIDSINSPHAFLPDPCSEAYAANPEKAKSIISMYTTFISTADYISGKASKLPKAGDLIKVRLRKNFFSYDLVWGEFLGIIDAKNISIVIKDKSVECTDIPKTFDSSYLSTIQSLRGDNVDRPGTGCGGANNPVPNKNNVIEIDASATTYASRNKHGVKVPGGNNYRFEQPHLGHLKWFFESATPAVKRVIRFNGNGSGDLEPSTRDGVCLTVENEAKFIADNYPDVEFIGFGLDKRGNAHRGYQKGQGYIDTCIDTDKLLSDPVPTLVHCKSGVDRTGFTVAYYLKNTVGGSWKSDPQKLWDYTVDYNRKWKISNSGGGHACKESGYAKCVDGFWSLSGDDGWCNQYMADGKKKRWDGCASCKDTRIVTLPE